MSRILAFAQYGGKFRRAPWIIERLPQCIHYCEPYGGAASVLLNRAPASLETFNDTDGEIVNFFEVLRKHPEELTREINLTPYSYEEYLKGIQVRKGSGGKMDPIERARLFYVVARMTRFGLVQKPSPGRWLFSRKDSRGGVAGVVSRWLGGQRDLEEVASRLLAVQIECREALVVIKKCDMDTTLFFCDPPYPVESRSGQKAYIDEMSDDDHRELSAVLHNIEGMAAITGYRCDLMDQLYVDWERHDMDSRSAPMGKKIEEAMWTNYKVRSLEVERL